MSLFLDIVGAIFVLIGIVLVYDARPITKSFLVLVIKMKAR